MCQLLNYSMRSTSINGPCLRVTFDTCDMCSTTQWGRASELLALNLELYNYVKQSNHPFFRWERKLPMSKSPLESTWLFHEIGRCYLELDKYSEAKDNGEQSETAALDAEDKMWQLQALVLTAQAEGKARVIVLSIPSLMMYVVFLQKNIHLITTCICKWVHNSVNSMLLLYPFST